MSLRINLYHSTTSASAYWFYLTVNMIKQDVRFIKVGLINDLLDFGLRVKFIESIWLLETSWFKSQLRRKWFCEKLFRSLLTRLDVVWRRNQILINFNRVYQKVCLFKFWSNFGLIQKSKKGHGSLVRISVWTKPMQHNKATRCESSQWASWLKNDSQESNIRKHALRIIRRFSNRIEE